MFLQLTPQVVFNFDRMYLKVIFFSSTCQKKETFRLVFFGLYRFKYQSPPGYRRIHLTFRRIHTDPRLVQVLLVAPVPVSLNGSEPVQQHQCRAQTPQQGPAPSSPQSDTQGSRTGRNQ